MPPRNLCSKREELWGDFQGIDSRHYFETTSGIDPTTAWPDLNSPYVSVEFAVEASYQRAALMIRQEHERKRSHANREAWAFALRQTKGTPLLVLRPESPSPWSSRDYTVRQVLGRPSTAWSSKRAKF